MVCSMLVLVITFVSLTNTGNVRRHAKLVTPRCLASHPDYKKIDNETIHLVHNSDDWTKEQVDVLKGILHNYNASKVHVVIVGCSKASKVIPQDNNNPMAGKRFFKNRAKEARYKKKERRRQRRYIANLSQCKTLQDVLLGHPDILLERISYTEAFHNSSLQRTWPNLNAKTKLLALRTVYMWQYGGLTFDLFEESYKNFSRFYNQKVANASETALVEKIVLEFKALKNLLKGIIIIDHKGWHMESGTTCHAFFGDILTILQTAKKDDFPEHIIKMALDVFCKKGSVEPSYCASVN